MDQNTLWYQCCRPNLARLQTAAVSQEEKLSPSQAEFGHLPEVIHFSLLNKTSFAVLCAADTLCSLEGSGCRQSSEEQLSIPPPQVGIRLKIVCTHSWMWWDNDQSGLQLGMFLCGLIVSTWIIKSVPTVGLRTAAAVVCPTYLNE